ncbi:hypothetical protein B0H66DRAFT_570027 [Apodospora peruviana]|uniref:Modin n=1 Tax=Apodospora peruviana TaxID=516989 RepID=A0AAE0HSK6_9PEZI|nr:hypothetical protein B0H66DRAFT_570027 [Apodospora peruviana]
MADDKSNNDYYVAIAALVISTLALLGVVVQYIQTIVATANGLPNRDKEVMGQWAPYTRIRWGFFHVEVEYEAPIIFLAANDNPKGPLPQIPWYVDGTPRSCQETRVEEPNPDPELGGGSKDSSLARSGESGLTRERVHTVKNELATWILVIGAAQKMERDSRAWEQSKWGAPGNQPDLPKTADGRVYASLAVNIQPWKRSFDKHPAVKKPFATTAICHIVELCAILGIYWREFDRDNNKYRAEGNGYSVLGSRVSDFGLVFTFEKPGWPRFLKNRVIPTTEVKELCFGNVPTFYRPRNEDENWKQPVNDQSDLKTLQLGSRAEIAETLNLIRCNEYTTRCYSDPAKKHTHLFPVIFEVLGMLARPLHLMNRPFTYLPNPAVFPLNKQAFSLRRLLAEFSGRLDKEVTSTTPTYTHPEELISINARAKKLHREMIPENQDGDYSPLVLNNLHVAIDEVDGSVLSENKNAKDVVLDVLRRHVQEVLLAINTSKDSDAGGDYSPLARSLQLQPAEMIIKGEISFDDLLKVPHEKRESSLMEKYFEEICLRVVSTSPQHHDPQAAAASRFIHGQEGSSTSRTGLGLQALQEEGNGDDHVPVSPDTVATGGTAQSTPKTPVDESQSGWGLKRRTTVSSVLSRSETWRKSPPTQAEVRRHVIWCALMFRMICWLMLHDFDKKDVQLPKSELMGSRLSVFIV